MLPLYDHTKTFAENSQLLQQRRYHLLPTPIQPQRTLLHFKLNSLVGVPACCITTGHGIALLSQLGFDILTYKTVRGRATPPHPLPNIVFLKNPLHIDPHNSQPYITAEFSPHAIALSNSFGNACLDLEFTARDIALAKQALKPGQILIVSIYEEADSVSQLIKNYLKLASLVTEAGADIIELNFSCPNLSTVSATLDTHCAVARAISQTFKQFPVIAKLGYTPNFTELKKTLAQFARTGLAGICGINTYPAQVQTHLQQPAFGSRKQSGISGAPLRPLALEFIRHAREIIDSQHLDLILLGTGGITEPHHFDLFLKAGANVALSATGMLFNPHLAFHYKNLV